jgi:hypothetical protein
MMLLDYWPLKRFESKKENPFLWQLKEKLPFFILSAAVFAMLVTSPPPKWEHFPFLPRLFNGIVSFVSYLGKTFWPQNMAVFYPFPTHIPLWQILGASFLIIAMTVAVMAMVKRLPYLFVGWMWFSITIFPVTGIFFQIWLCAMTDRYHYLPSIGLAVMLAWGVPSLIKSEDLRKKILFPAGILFIAALSFITWKQCGYWKNGATVFNHAILATNHNYLAHANLGPFLVEEGKITEAIYHYDESIRINPDFADAYFNRGNAFSNLGQYQDAIEDYNKAIYLEPDFAETYNNRGVAYYKLARYESALENFNRAIILKPNSAMQYNNRAYVYLILGQNGLGCDDMQRACKLGNCKILESMKDKGYCL